ncbi:40S ribosomal protein S13 [Metarhizium acridum CQMa 102]|uniref:40S ribosomal protein S13 n=1 Tax=Metarhizium acridum (strain CQMa 102) TaxID=655827 RepID=E9EE46_METAQ|nr:40S ribosomal protein S13 [Metarhizium acridum CQMa 102]EFY85832.1 40S ribosomal protein S13 [Metarhizium acridum CQMa 102]
MTPAALLWLSLRLPTHSALTKRKFAAPHKTSRLATLPTELPDHSFIVDQQDNTDKMGRLHSKGKGISASAIPYSRAAPAWLKTTPEQVVEQICKLARKGATPSQIGVILRDSHGVAQVKIVTVERYGTLGAFYSDVVKEIYICQEKHISIFASVRSRLTERTLTGLAPELPEDLYMLIKKAVSVRKHLERNRKDKDSKFRLILIESRIHRLARYYKTVGVLPPTWKYESATASTIVA